MTEQSTGVEMTAGADLVRVERRDRIAIVSLNRPDRHNAVNDEVAELLAATFRWLHGETDLRAVVLRGEGRSFCSGRDTSVLGKRARGETDLEFIRIAQGNNRLISEMPCPVIAALKGWVLGGGFEKALHCDIRIAAEDAKMALPEVSHGVIPDTGGVSRLCDLAGPGLTKDMVLTGRVLTAAEALAAGVVSRVVPLEELDRTAEEIATTIASRSPLPVRLAREVIDDLSRATHDQALRQELLAQVACFGSEDYRELKQARAEKRDPVFRGR